MSKQDLYWHHETNKLYLDRTYNKPLELHIVYDIEHEVVYTTSRWPIRTELVFHDLPSSWSVYCSLDKRPAFVLGRFDLLTWTPTKTQIHYNISSLVTKTDDNQQSIQAEFSLLRHRYSLRYIKSQIKCLEGFFDRAYPVSARHTHVWIPNLGLDSYYFCGLSLFDESKLACPHDIDQVWPCSETQCVALAYTWITFEYPAIKATDIWLRVGWADVLAQLFMKSKFGTNSWWIRQEDEMQALTAIEETTTPIDRSEKPSSHSEAWSQLSTEWWHESFDISSGVCQTYPLNESFYHSGKFPLSYRPLHEQWFWLPEQRLRSRLVVQRLVHLLGRLWIPKPGTPIDIDALWTQVGLDPSWIHSEDRPIHVDVFFRFSHKIHCSQLSVFRSDFATGRSPHGQTETKIRSIPFSVHIHEDRACADKLSDSSDYEKTWCIPVWTKLVEEGRETQTRHVHRVLCESGHPRLYKFHSAARLERNRARKQIADETKLPAYKWLSRKIQDPVLYVHLETSDTIWRIPRLTQSGLMWMFQLHQEQTDVRMQLRAIQGLALCADPQEPLLAAQLLYECLSNSDYHIRVRIQALQLLLLAPRWPIQYVNRAAHLALEFHSVFFMENPEVAKRHDFSDLDYYFLGRAYWVSMCKHLVIHQDCITSCRVVEQRLKTWWETEDLRSTKRNDEYWRIDQLRGLTYLSQRDDMVQDTFYWRTRIEHKIQTSFIIDTSGYLTAAALELAYRWGIAWPESVKYPDHHAIQSVQFRVWIQEMDIERIRTTLDDFQRPLPYRLQLIRLIYLSLVTRFPGRFPPLGTFFGPDLQTWRTIFNQTPFFFHFLKKSPSDPRFHFYSQLIQSIFTNEPVTS